MKEKKTKRKELHGFLLLLPCEVRKKWKKGGEKHNALYVSALSLSFGYSFPSPLFSLLLHRGRSMILIFILRAQERGGGSEEKKKKGGKKVA